MLASFSLLLTAFGLEGVLRLAGFAPKEPIFQPSKVLLSELKPSLTDASYRLSHTITTNSLGFRGPEFEPLKPSHVYRVIALGDSFTMGFLVREDQTYPYLLQQIGQAPQGNQLEVINAGISGYGTENELQLFRTRLVEFQPDMVVLGFVLNDVAGNGVPLAERIAAAESQGMEAWRAEPEKYQYGISPRRIEFPFEALLKSRFAVANFLSFVWQSVNSGGNVPGDENDPLFAEPPTDWMERNWAVSFSILDDLWEASEAGGARLVLMIYPYRNQVVGRQHSTMPQTKIIQWAETRCVPYLDLLPVLQKHSDERLFAVDKEHPGALANHYIASSLAPIIVAPPKPCPD